MMELLSSNNTISQQMASNSTSNSNQQNNATASAERLLAGILDSFPSFDLNGTVGLTAAEGNNE